MSLGRVPQDVVNLFEGLTGMKWPMMDADAMYRLADVYRQTGRNITDKMPDLFNGAVNTLTEQFKMSATDPFVASMAQFTSGEPNYLAQLADAAGELGDFVAKTGADAEYTKLMILAQLVELLAEIAFAIMMAECGFFEWLFNLTIEYLISREFILAALRWLFTNIARHVVLGVATGVAMDRIIQRIQINEHHRDDFDNDLLLQAVEYGVIGGVLAGPLGHLGAGLGKGIGKVIGRDVTSLLSHTLGDLFTRTFGKDLGEAGAKAFAADVAKLMGHAAPDLLKKFTDGGAGFAKSLADVFEKHLGGTLGADAARELGRAYGAALAGHWGTDGLEAALRGAVHETADRIGGEAGAALRAGAGALAKDLPDAVRTVLKESPHGTLRYRAGGQLGQFVGDWAHGNLSEGFYNLIFDPSHSFHTNWMTGAATGAMSRAHHAGHWAGNKIGDRFFPNRPSIRSLLGKYLSGGGVAPPPAVGATPPAATVHTATTEHPPGHDGHGPAPSSTGDTSNGGSHHEPQAVPNGSGAPHPVTPAPDHVPPGDPRRGDWQRDQRDLADTYHARLTDLARIQHTMETVRPAFDQGFTDWVTRRVGDGSIRALADTFGVPPSRLATEQLDRVRDRALTTVTDRVTRFVATTPEAALDRLSDEFDRQAVRLAGHLAVEQAVDHHLVDSRWTVGGTDEPPAPVMSAEATEVVRQQVTDSVRSYLDERLDPLLAGGAGGISGAGGDLVGRAHGVVQEIAGKVRARIDLETARLVATDEAAQAFDSVAGGRGVAPPRTDNTDPVTAALSEFRARAIGRLKLDHLAAVDTLFQTTYGHLDPFASSTGTPPPHGGWDAALAELTGGLPDRLAIVEAWDQPLADRWDRLRVVTDEWKQRARPDAGALFDQFGLDGAEPDAAVLAAVRDRFFATLGAGFRAAYPDGPGHPPDPTAAGAWDRAVATAIEVLPHAIARETALHRARRESEAALDAYLATHDPVSLNDGALDRVRAALRERVDAAFAARFPVGGGDRDAGDDPAGFRADLAALTAGLDRYLGFESDATAGLARAGGMFDEVAGPHQVDDATRRALAADFRRDWFTAFHDAWAPHGGDVDGWLDLEAAHGTAFAPARPATESSGPDSQIRYRATPPRPEVATTSSDTPGIHEPARTDDGPEVATEDGPPLTGQMDEAGTTRRPSPVDTAAVPVDSVWVHPFTGVRTRAAFDARTRTENGETVTELTVKATLRPDETVTAEETAATWATLQKGVAEHFTEPGYRLAGYGRLRVTVEPAGEGEAHLVVDLSTKHSAVTQTRWRPGLSAASYAHELGHQLGLREENRQPGEPDELVQVDGSLMGRFDVPSPDGLSQGGVRQRHLDLLAGLIDAARDGGPPSAPSPHRVPGLSEPRLPSLGAMVGRITRSSDGPDVIPLRDLGSGPAPRPMSRAEAERWVAGRSTLPDNAHPTEAQKWAYLRELEQRNRSIPTPPAHVPGRPRPVRQAVHEKRDRRPFVVDGPAPDPPTGTVEFGDHHRVPARMSPTPGRDRPTFAMPDRIARRLADAHGLSAAETAALAGHLRDRPERFFGEGFRFPTGHGDLIVRAANHGNWDRYSAAPTTRPERRAVVATVARRAFTLRRRAESAVLHIDDVHFSATGGTSPHAGFTVHNGLHWRAPAEVTRSTFDRDGLPEDIVFTGHQPLGDVEVEGVSTPLAATDRLIGTVFPGLSPAARTTLREALTGDSLTTTLPDLVKGWTELPGSNPPGIRIRAVVDNARLVHPSEQPPVRRPATGGGGLGAVANSVFHALSRSGGAPMRDATGRYGVYDANVRIEVERLDGRHQPDGPGGRHPYRIPATARLRLGHGEARRLAGPPPAPPNRTGAVPPRPHPVPTTVSPVDAASALIHGGDEHLLGLDSAVPAHPAVRSIGVPRAGLPHLNQVVDTVRSLAAAAGVTVPDRELRTLPQRLLANYRQALGGLQVELGKAEALITLDPTQPWKVVHPSGSFDAPSHSLDPAPAPAGSLHSGGTTNGAFQTGTHNQSHSGQLGSFNAAASLSGGFGLAPGVAQVAKVAASVSGTANKVSRSVGIAEDAETGMVEDTRDTSTLLAYVPNWRVQVRVDANIPWDEVPHTAVDGPLHEKLLLWVPDHYLRESPSETVLPDRPPAGGPEPAPPELRGPPVPPKSEDPAAQGAHETAMLAWHREQAGYYRDLAAWQRDREHRRVAAGHEHDLTSLPDTLFASGLTNLPRLFDSIVAQLKEGGLALPIGHATRGELMQKLWNLDTNLRKAVNDPAGYHFSLHEAGRTVATVTVNTTRDTEVAPEQVGDTTDLAHVENVRTAIAGVSGSQSVNQSSQGTVSAEVDLVPVPGLTAGASAYLGVNWSNSDSFGAGRTGLWVLVSRYAGYTNGYHVGLAHTATVHVHSDTEPSRTTAPVTGAALLRLPEPAAFQHGFPVKTEAIVNPTTGLAPLPGTVRRTGVDDDGPQAAPLPLHVLKGKGLGQALVAVEPELHTEMKAGLENELRETGFLPQDPANPWHSGVGRKVLERQLDNQDLVEKMVSQAGLDSHYDQLHQDGMTFTLTRRTEAGRLRYARITVTASQHLEEYTDEEGDRHSQYHVLRTSEYHAVNLSMGMDSAQPGAGGGKKLFFGFRGMVGYGGGDPKGAWFKGGSAGAEYQRSVGANEGLFLMVNRPELLELPGALDEFRLPSDYTVRIEYSDLPDPEPIPFPHRVATVHLPPAFNNPAKAATGAKQPTSREVLDQAVIFHLDSSGITAAARALLPDLTGPGGINDELVTKFASNISVRSHLKEIVAGEYATDQLFEPGLWRDGTGALALKGELGDSEFAGATEDKYVIGLIKLWLAQATQSTTKSDGVTVSTDLSFGGTPPETSVAIGGGTGGNLHWGAQSSESSARTGAKEFLELDFHRAYAFRSTVDFTAYGAHEKHGKLAWSSTATSVSEPLTGKDMIYVLSEHDALTRYAENKVPLPDEQLEDALNRWHDGELRLRGDTVAGMLLRRRAEANAGSGWGPDRMPLDLWARAVATRHAAGEIHLSEDVVTRFLETFPRSQIGTGTNPFADRWIPPNLTRNGPKALGHSGIHELTFESDPARNIAPDPSPFSLVHSAVEQAAPGLIGKAPEVWGIQSGSVVGRLQGGIDGLQALLSGRREQPLTEDMMHTEGQSFLLVNKVGWMLADVVEVNLKYTLTTDPEVLDLVPDTGLENYGHAYTAHSKGKQRDFSYGATLPRLSAGGGPGGLSGAGQFGFGAGSHRSSTRAETGTTEQTIYDWTGHYRVRFGHRLHIEVRRLNMVGRPANNLLTGAYRRLAGHTTPVTSDHAGHVTLKIPRSTGDARPLMTAHRPDYSPVPSWPGDGYVTAALLDDAAPIARRLLAGLLGPEANDPAYRSSLSLPVELSRTHLTNHLVEAIGGKRYLLSDSIFVPGHSSDRARVWLAGDLHDIEVIAPIESGTGPGRYSKFQDGTTNSVSSDTLTPNWQLSADANGPVQIVDPSHPTAPWGANTLDGSANVGNGAAHGQGVSHTENYRREQHVKQQGPTHLVRLRGRFRLEAEAMTANLFGKDTPIGTHRSDPFSGDVYAELTAGELAELQARMRERNAVALTDDDPAHWPRPDRDTPKRNLTDLLTRAGRRGFDQFQAGGEVARELRDEYGGNVPLVLVSRAGEGVVRTYRAVLDWAVREPSVANAARQGLREELGRIPDLLRLARGPMNAGAIEELERIRQRTLEITNGIVASSPFTSDGPLSRLNRPPVDLDPVATARQIAYELDTFVDVHHIDLDGVSHRYRIDPSARTYELDEHGVVLTVEAALAKLGIGGRVELAELSTADLTELYLSSGPRQQTFETAVRVEVQRRLETLIVPRALADLPAGLRAAVAGAGLGPAALVEVYERGREHGLPFAKVLAAELANVGPSLV